MTLRQLLIIMFIATALCWLTWGLVLVQTDPTGSGVTGLLLFYASLFFSLLGTFFLLTFAWRRIFNRFSLEYKIVGISFRQSVFFAFLVVGTLLLQSVGLLRWWNLILLILAVAVVEFFFISIKRNA